MKLLPSKSLASSAIILTLGFLVSGCGFVALPYEELSQEEELQIHELLYGAWYLSQVCNWARGQGCMEFSKDNSLSTLTFYEGGRVTHTGWGENGLQVESEWTYTIEKKLIRNRVRTILSISGMMPYAIDGISVDRFLMDPMAPDAIGKEYRRL